MAASLGASYTLRFTSAIGVPLGITDRFLDLQITRVVNAPGSLTLTLALSDLAFSRRLITRDMRIDVYRAPAGRPSQLYTDTGWLVRKVRYRPSTGEVVVGAAALIDVLGGAVIAGAPNSAAAVKTGAAEVVMTDFVQEQVGLLANSVRRVPGLLVLPLVAATPVVGANVPQRVLLKVLQDLADETQQQGHPIYFDVVADGDGVLRFATFVGQRGNDRRVGTPTPLIFSEDRNNLLDAEVEDDWSQEATVVYAVGAGQGDQQAVVEVVSGRTTESLYARREQVVLVHQTKDPQVLIGQARAALWKTRPRRVVTGAIQNTNTTQYGRDWFWGDLVTVVVDGDYYDARIDSVEVSVRNNDEQITARFRTEVLL